MTSTEERETVQAGRCVCCGAVMLMSDAEPRALVAVCDVLVVRALEVVGKRIVRVDRSRFNRLPNQRWHLAHTFWQPSSDMIDKALAKAWDVVPAMMDSHGCCGVTSHAVTEMLDRYVKDLLITGTAHDLDELRYRFSAALGVATAGD